MKFTDFKELEEAISQMGIILHPVEELPSVEMIFEKGVEIGELILSDSGGIYKISSTEGVITRLTLNICDIDIQFPKRTLDNIKDIILNKDFDNKELIERLHKYHFTYCRTLKKFHEDNKEERYYGSSRWTGEFTYRFIASNQVISENSRQKLYPCKHCLRNLSKKTNENYNPDSFNIQNVFKISNQFSESYSPECESVPNIYSKDWPTISKKMKQSKEYRCERCGQGPFDSKDLHCHHINLKKNDNRRINLEVLCIPCHKKEHSHMR
ncbi:MAG: HNH endonuclease signature motif containing protein [Halobacteriovoraceae bacterium]|nr:HNH endonuclease signature motif containing protein [Halobacteriovoraceae bacterium]